MSRFHQILNKGYKELITEQEQPPVPPAPEETTQAAPEQAAPTPVPEIPEQQPETEAFSPEGMVFLVRMIAKALMIERLDPDEENKIVEFGDINEINAKDALKEFLPIIQRYAPSFESIPRI
jgi:hypothetical protein